jgi:hypothetical protein
MCSVMRARRRAVLERHRQRIQRQRRIEQHLEPPDILGQRSSRAPIPWGIRVPFPGNGRDRRPSFRAP